MPPIVNDCTLVEIRNISNWGLETIHLRLPRTEAAPARCLQDRGWRSPKAQHLSRGQEVVSKYSSYVTYLLFIQIVHPLGGYRQVVGVSKHRLTFEAKLLV